MFGVMCFLVIIVYWLSNQVVSPGIPLGVSETPDIEVVPGTLALADPTPLSPQRIELQHILFKVMDNPHVLLCQIRPWPAGSSTIKLGTWPDYSKGLELDCPGMKCVLIDAHTVRCERDD